MATNRGMLKEAIAEAKAVKDMAIANAKLALEETFSPQLQELLSLKLQEMADEDSMMNMEDDMMNMEDDMMNMNEYDDMNEIDLEELLAELENDSLNEGEEDEEEEEGEDMEMENLSDEDLKAAVEEVIAQMIKSGELEAGPEFGENEEEEEESEEEESEEDVDLAELLREIEEMESEQINEWSWDPSSNEILIGFLIGSLGGLAAFTAAYFGLRKGAKKEGIENQIKSLITAPKARKEEMLKKILQDLEANPQLKASFQSTLDKIQNDMDGVNEAEETGDPVLDALKSLNISSSDIVKGSEKIEQLAQGKASSQNEEIEAMEEELMEANKTISVLRSELNEINLLNAKLLYSNKIFKAKNLNESQKVKVLSSFDKAKNVSEVKIVFETLNEGIRTAKTTIKENLGRASKSTNTPTTKRPILESNDSFKRMQKLAGLI
jgi:hypothetical protein